LDAASLSFRSCKIDLISDGVQSPDLLAAFVVANDARRLAPPRVGTKINHVIHCGGKTYPFAAAVPLDFCLSTGRQSETILMQAGDIKYRISGHQS